MLDLAQCQELPPFEPVQPLKRRNPLLALAISAIFPGLGHLYLGMRRNAIWIAGFELLCVGIVAGGEGTLHAQGIFAAPILYCFALIDSYFAAREYNAGVDSLLIGTNPRVVAVLNLITKGFGYFYLGDRAKGIICFLVCSAVQAAIMLRFNVWTSILALSLQATIAVDGYRVARQRLLANHPELVPTPNSTDGLIARANPGGLPPAAATAFFITVGVIFLIGYGTLRAITGHFITSQGTLENGPEGLSYRNTAENLAITVPETWDSARTERSLIMLKGNGASIILMDEYSMSAAASNIEADHKDTFFRHPDATFLYPHTVISNHFAQSLEFSFTSSSGTEVHQRITYIRRNIKLIILIETWVDDQQRLTLDQIEKNVTI